MFSRQYSLYYVWPMSLVWVLVYKDFFSSDKPDQIHVQCRTKKMRLHVIIFYFFSTTMESFVSSDTSVVVINQCKSNCTARLSYFYSLKLEKVI